MESRLLREDLFIHFGVSGHEIPIEQAIITDQSIKIIVEEFSKNLFEGKFNVRILVTPVKEGSQLKKYFISAVIFMGGLSAQPLVDASLRIFVNGKNMEENFVIILSKLKTSVKDFLEKDTNYLEKSGITKDKFVKAYVAKNNFYKACLDNDEVTSLGFDDSVHFPIKRNDFVNRVTGLSKSDLEPIEKFHKLKVVSSIQTKEDENRVWQVKDIKKGEIKGVYIKDENFYDFYWQNSLLIKNFVVKVRYLLEIDENGEIKFQDKGKEIIKVYEYNGKKFADIPANVKMDPFPLEIDKDSGQLLVRKIEDNKGAEKDEAKVSLFDYKQ